MTFDIQTWREGVAEQAEGWKARWEQARSAGVTSLYAFLSVMALWPVVEAAQQGDWAALAALGSVAAGVGGNLLANQIQAWKDEAEAARALAETVEENDDVRRALDAVLAELTVLAQAEMTLDGDDHAWFVSTLRREMAHLGNWDRFEATLTGSGAIAQGEGAKAAGERGVVADEVHAPVITGDRSTVIYDTKEARARKARRRYLKRLRQRCNVLPLAALGGEEGVGEEITLERVYVDLDTRSTVPLTEEERERAERWGPSERRLSALEVATANRRLVLLGDPGSGKSTFARQVAARLAGVQLGEADPFADWEEELVPLLVVLRELGPRLSAMDLASLPRPKQNRALVRAVREHWEETLAQAYDAEAWAPCLEDLLTDGNLLLIFDGLDEVASACRKWVRRGVLAVLESYPAIQRVLVTSRIRSYAGESVLPGFARHTLAPFDREKIHAFVVGWYEAQVALGRLTVTKADDRIDDLQNAALGDDLQELASNPMLLTSMAIIHQREVGLPKERVRLYSLAVQVLLNRWQKHKGIDVSEALSALLGDDLQLREILERLAYSAHQGEACSDEAVALERKDLLAMLENPEYLGDVGLAGEFLDYVDRRAGLMVGQGGGVGQLPHTYTFPHRTFQEYLAGCHMVGRRGTEREYWARADESDVWYLAAQLGAEELLYNRRSENDVLDLAYALSPKATEVEEGTWDEQHWRATLWSGQMAVLLGRERIRRDEGGPGSGEDYLERLIPRLVHITREAPLGAVERTEAGNALAKLGDPRPGVGIDEETGLPDIVWCEVPAGPFVMGEGDDRHRNESITEGYLISRYPITNGQFDAFVEAGSYEEARYWSEAEASGVWSGGQVKGRWDDEARDSPHDYGEPFNLSNHPVVGVSWYEALAFCRWLEERLRVSDEGLRIWRGDRIETLSVRSEGLAVRLPSGAEWERAARGTDGRRYPWGEEPDPNRASYDDTGIGTTSAVGCFPGGASPYGVEDLSGNVWEWTRSHYRDYPYEPEDGRENLEAGTDVPRVLRGGAFYLTVDGVRCAGRYRSFPDSRSGDGGFRVVVAPFSPTSGL